MAPDQNQDNNRVPRHVAIIMDGNGRWAKQRTLPRIEGHRAGSSAASRAMKACIDTGIKYLTLYSFSTENWDRSESEVNSLMSLFYEALTEHIGDLTERKVRLRAIGDIDRLPAKVQDALREDISLTEANSALTLTLAVSYGAREEIVEACKTISRSVQNAELKIEDIDKEIFANSLWTAGIPDPDLLIRTSGEMRISNFLLWQLAYSEIIVIPEYWPEFDSKILQRCISEYNQRERRFGKTSEQVNGDKSNSSCLVDERTSSMINGE